MRTTIVNRGGGYFPAICCWLGAAAGIALMLGAAPSMAADGATTGQEELEVVTVLGSRIPSAQREGPAPVTTISADDIRDGGYASVPDVLKTVTQNSGETQSQQSGNAADFSPGAQQVDLRGLGPNHTLVMVNGRRIADYPLPFNGSSNFTDISNIPLSLIDKIEILSGSASAIYGSDALAGVVNFKLKDHAEGTTIDYRYGWNEQGGGASHRLSASSGFSRGRFHGLFGGELLLQDPVYGYQRKAQDSTLDAPVAAYRTPVTNWQRLDADLYYANDATRAQCALSTFTNGGTTHYAIDDYYGDGGTILGAYCGSESAVGYRTVQSKHHAINLVGFLGFDLNDATHLFADLQFGSSKIELLKRPTSWSYEDETGDDTGSFYNSHDGIYDNWYRIFTPEEMGGLDAATRHVDSTTVTLTPGVRGTLGANGKWNYETALNYSLYDSKVTFPLINFRKANALFLGPQIGVDTDPAFLGVDGYGYPVFDADPTRFYTPLTPTEYASIAEDSIYKPRSSVGNLTAQLSTNDLVDLPAGPIGFAAQVELGRQNYDLGTDPKATAPYYFSWIDSPGKGHRTDWASGIELRVPLFAKLQGSAAGRYDHFDYAGHNVGQGTYNLGLEYRPVPSLLLRAAYGTGFRAPDLNYVYKGVGYIEGSAPDYYQCLLADPTANPSDCSDSRFQVQTSGSLALKPESSKSFNGGFVWSPWQMFDLSADYFNIDMSGVVEDLEVDPILRDEAECRLGIQDINSPTCVDALARVIRNNLGDVRTVVINPINVARESTDGYDFSAHLRFDTPIGHLAFSASLTHVNNHDYTRFAGDAALSKLAVNSDYYIPQDKASFGAKLTAGRWSFNIDGNYLGRLPNYDEVAWLGSYTTYNGSVRYSPNEELEASVAVVNLFDARPPYDGTWVSYPYYNSNWYDGNGRSAYLQLSYRFRGR